MRDGVTGMYYLRARYYSPGIGRFTQADSYHGDGLNLYVYAGNNPVGYVDPSGFEKENGVDASDASTRLIPGTEGVTTGGSSSVLGENLFKDMGLDPNTSRKGYQAQHIIPKEFMEHPILKKIGMDFDDASNGIFLRNRKSGGVSAMSRHQGGHPQYSNVILEQLEAMDINKSVSELEKEVFKLQQAAKRMMQDGNPIYACDYAPTTTNSRISAKSEKIYGMDASARIEDFIRRMLKKYGI